MKSSGFGSRSRGAAAAMLLAGSLMLGGSPALAQDADLSALTGSITSDGSSTVGPLTQAVAEEFIGAAPQVEISVDISGTGGGFERFCAGETDVQNASRAIAEEEIANCAANGVDWYEFEVAYDGITVVTNKENTWASCLTVDQLKQLWQKESPAVTWADLNAEWPAETVNLYGPGTDSGTFDFFVETILGEDDIREDFQPSEDDNVLVSGVAGDVNALGYFGLAYYEANQDSLSAVGIDNGSGECVAPSQETVRDGSYAPLSRPLYVYVSASALERPEVQEFTRFYLENAAVLAPEVGYVASPDDVYAADMEAFEADVAGEGAPDSQQASATPAA
ncbi:MAG: PstS family phosphate ABC transporter substrate-binding protein [Thermomicrobiales bacterium]